MRGPLEGVFQNHRKKFFIFKGEVSTTQIWTQFNTESPRLGPPSLSLQRSEFDPKEEPK